MATDELLDTVDADSSALNSYTPSLKATVAYGNVACKSDAQVAAKALETAMFGAYYDVTVNLKDVADDAFRRATQKRVTASLQEAKDRAAVVLNAADKTN
ncbi:hypothetical protein Q5P01_000507 [Channa striata]|uniref:Cyclodeaminase/cyclohydrolase domain-containing protein n=1 Tax=Channa striata TaxID=64152 RepID=A0AA88IH22_CHASR|nr:hypothetical protein Q5P01_000507 [Channa striata]